MSALRFEADIAGLDKPQFVAAIARACNAPEYFGGNWDALADVLQDLSWQPAQEYELVLRGQHALSEEELSIARAIFDDTANFWGEQGRSFRVTWGYKQPVSALVVIYTPHLEVLLLERADYPGYWQSVTGSRDGEESLRETAIREVGEETGIDAARYKLTDWQQQNVYDIYAKWAHRYPPGTTHNTEHVFGLEVPERVEVRTAPREHLSHQWLPWREAADKVFSPSNREAILQLPERVSCSKT